MNTPRSTRSRAATLMFGVALVALPWVGAQAQTTPAAPQEDNTLQPSASTFETIDANADGFIEKKEIPANDPLANEFMKLDDNGDDKLSRDEYDDRD